MDACAESEVPIRLAIEDTAIRIGELDGVTIRRGVVDDHRFTGAELCPFSSTSFATVRGMPWIDPAKRMNSSTAFGMISGSRDEPVAFLGICCDIMECEGHRARRRFEAGLHQKHRVGDDVGERQLLTVDLGGESTSIMSSRGGSLVRADTASWRC